MAGVGRSPGANRWSGSRFCSYQNRIGSGRPLAGLTWGPFPRSVMSESLARSVGGRVAAAGALLVLVVAVGLGALTELGQSWLPQSTPSLAHSGGAWGAVAV